MSLISQLEQKSAPACRIMQNKAQNADFYLILIRTFCVVSLSGEAYPPRCRRSITCEVASSLDTAYYCIVSRRCNVWSKKIATLDYPDPRGLESQRFTNVTFSLQQDILDLWHLQDALIKRNW